MQLYLADIGRRVKVRGTKGYWYLGGLKDNFADVFLPSEYPRDSKMRTDVKNITIPKSVVLSNYCNQCGRGGYKRVKN
jgi:hypothetical protein